MMNKYFKSGLTYTLTILLLFSFCAEGFASRSRSRSRRPSKKIVKEAIAFIPSESLSLVENIISYSKLYLGSPYRSGSKGPGGFDCSGFTHFVFSKFDYKLGASSTIQATEGSRLEEEDVQPGDLIFFKGRNSKASRVGHVGIVLAKEENGNIKFIHSACGSGVCVSELNEPYYKSRYVGCNRIIQEAEPERKLIYLQYMYPPSPDYSPRLYLPQGSIKEDLSFLR